MARFEQPSPTDDRPFLGVTQAVVEALEGITSAEKAQAVPHIKIWQINPSSGKPVHADRDGQPLAPLSSQLTTPPRFGQSGDERFRERPPVSIERITIKTDAPRNVITYRQLELTFVVHRPDIIFDGADDRDSWSSLIVPGAVHVLEYGWTAGAGVKNGIINGFGLDKDSVPAISQIRFTVTNYEFEIQANNEIRVTTHAWEDGHAVTSNAVLFPPKPVTPVKGAVPIAQPTQMYDEEGQQILEKFKRRVDGLKGDAAGFISLSKVFDALFADVMVDSYRVLGYSDPKLIIGDFNERVGTPAKERFRLRENVESLKEDPPRHRKWIGDFQMRLADVKKNFSRLLTIEHQQITLSNFIAPFLNTISQSDTWDRGETSGAKDKTGRDANTVPLILMRAAVNPARRSVTVRIFDVRREFTKFSDSDYTKGVDSGGRPPTRQKVREICLDKRIPVISFLRGNSYIQDARFGVIQDEQIKGIFVRQYLAPTRDQVLDVSKKQKLDRLPGASKVLYSSSIQGDVTMLGNFAFDLFGLVWLDFGVPVWSGPFFVYGKEETIEQGGFFVRYNFISAGDDPLGTQGRREALAILRQEEQQRKLAESQKPQKQKSKK